MHVCGAWATSSTFDREESDRPVLKAKTFTLKSGNELQIDIGRERFHAPEIIFQVSPLEHDQKTPQFYGRNVEMKNKPDCCVFFLFDSIEMALSS